MKGFKVILILMIVFALSTIGLSIWLGFAVSRNGNNQTLLENQYQKAYYVLLDETSDMEIKISKLVASSSSNTQREMLYSVWKSSEVAANSLSSLSSRDATITSTMRFINQTGDFSKFLADKINKGENISSEHLSSLKKIQSMLKKFTQELSKIQEEIAKGYLFFENVNTENDLLVTILGGMNEASVEYPHLIYDGPFSDALNDKEVKGLTGSDITAEQGAEEIPEIFADNVVQNVRFMGEWSSDIVTLNYEAVVDGKLTTIQLAKKGGQLISVNAYREVGESTLSDEECISLCKTFLTRNKFSGMEAVWVCKDNGNYYINFAPLVENTIIYPDLIKIKIAADNGDILGLEARSYAFNHIERTLPTPALSVNEAKDKISVKGESTAGRLALIPFKTNEELLTYEFEITSDGTYYVYIDAKTGEEVNILYVISSTYGDLLV